jgi:hypothetical protein
MPATLQETCEIFMGCKVYRLTMTPQNTTQLNSAKAALSSQGIMGFGRTFKANKKYSFYIYYKPISHADTIVGGTASNISGWYEHSRIDVGSWKCVGQYRKGDVSTDKTDNIFTSFYSPSLALNQQIMIDFACPVLLEDTTNRYHDVDYLSYGNIIMKNGKFEVMTSNLTISSNMLESVISESGLSELNIDGIKIGSGNNRIIIGSATANGLSKSILDIKSDSGNIVFDTSMIKFNAKTQLMMNASNIAMSSNSSIDLNGSKINLNGSSSINLTSSTINRFSRFFKVKLYT